MVKMIVHSEKPNNGVFDDMRWKSSNERSMYTALAMAIKCNTAFVDPPNTMIKVIAFSKAALVIISLGLMSFFNKL